MRSHLPVPEFNENILNDSSKLLHRKDEQSKLKRPPKLRPRNIYESSPFNRSGNSSVLQISFRDTSCHEEEIYSPYYDQSNNETYFEQCFELVSKIGEGSFGEVFKVRSKEDGHLYAVKKSKKLFRSGPYRDERLEEVKRYEQFSNHNHCVKLYKAWEQNDRLYMQMELCEGSLEDYSRRNNYIPESKIWSILLDLLLALKILHDQNLLHLDIKLENILIGDDGLCKLADFGLVCDIERANYHQANEGDSKYIAPELLRGYFSKAADIFSLGISILELCSNIDLPQNGPLWHILRSGNLPEEILRPLSTELQTVITQMMAPNPMMRPTVDQLLNYDVILKLRRRRRDIFSELRLALKKVRKFIWAKICSSKVLIVYYFTRLWNIFKLTEENDKKSKESPNSSNEYLEFSSVHESPNNNFGNKSVNNIVNSTPLMHHSHSSIRSRKDLSKNNFRFLKSCDDNLNSSSVVGIAKQLFKSDSDSSE
ncbi:membrane-associated tyrosine- and threonine-specific cdc2-inhibitory kinase [Condylostylus longicornis]|uniref:membrane-associated tyrosine- and threonine-specific cdc2-inhibitory kinase n=1 Tax=Condylostylus longicornis TaxID=2530218 RepID=UPI00244E260B|nr:membrane-associated tyrosine- and threonine-specific cdc2-inhibitory kinase [Condylostylus longicornis]